jgi:hypothetical protein
MSYAQWNQHTQYVVGNQISYGGFSFVCIANVGPTTTLPSADPTKWTYFGPTNGVFPSGKHQCVTGTTQVITIPNLTTNGVVNLTYIHPPAGGAGQWFQEYTPTENTLTITLGQTATKAEFILWSVASL